MYLMSKLVFALNDNLSVIKNTIYMMDSKLNPIIIIKTT